MPTLYDLAADAAHALSDARSAARAAPYRDAPAAHVRLDVARARLDAVRRLLSRAEDARDAVARGERVLLCVPRHCTARDVAAMVETFPSLADVDLAHPALDGVSAEEHQRAWRGTVIA